MYYLLLAHLRLHNMLAKANDQSLTTRLSTSTEELDAGLAVIEREGNVAGRAGLDQH